MVYRIFVHKYPFLLYLVRFAVVVYRYSIIGWLLFDEVGILKYQITGTRLRFFSLFPPPSPGELLISLPRRYDNIVRSSVLIEESRIGYCTLWSPEYIIHLNDSVGKM